MPYQYEEKARAGHLGTDLEIDWPVSHSCLGSSGRSTVTHRRKKPSQRRPGVARSGIVACPSSMVEVASHRDNGDHGENEASCPKGMLRRCCSQLPSRAWVKSNRRSGRGQRKNSRDRRNRRHDCSMAAELATTGRRVGCLYILGMSVSI